jgi:sulfide:quinone oxidoreductase
MRVLVLGAGFGGLELTSRLADAFGDETDVVLLDQSDAFVFGFAKLDVLFGRKDAEAVRHPYADLVRAGVEFLQTTVRSIDPVNKTVETDAGAFAGDVMVVALGADLDPSATPGLVEGGHEFYSVEGAIAASRALADFEGGRVVVAVCGAPFKCPPAPSETALLVHDLLVRKGLRERSTVALVTPLPSPIPPAPDASKAVLKSFEERGIEFLPGSLVTRLDAERKVAIVGDGASELPYDLFLGVPKHKVPDVVAASGLAVDGWIPVDPASLETTFPGVYAVGDVTSVGTPKAGAFAEGQAATVADRLIAIARSEGDLPTYGGRGVCYLEFGEDRVGEVDVTFLPGQPPFGVFREPSAEQAAGKVEWAASRARRWFAGGSSPA